MIPELRREFNASFNERSYQRFRERLDHRCRSPIPFRIAETPLFVPRTFQRQCEEAAVALALQSHSPHYLTASDAALKPEYTVANQTDRSTFLTVDFAIAVDEFGTMVPRLIELQGFPSLMGFQLAYAELALEHYALPPALEYVNGGHSRAEFVALLRDAIVADADPENVVLLELDPWAQKTRADFTMIQELLGIEVADIRAVKKIDRVLHYERDGTWIPIQRIYNRTIVDELERRNIELPFNWNDDLDVEWAGHPNWYFRISKFALPFLQHPTVPDTRFLSAVDEIPDDLDNYVLKPLYSFAGAGVIVGPTREDVSSVAPDRRDLYVLQQRVRYADAIDTPEGPTKAELRVMLIWHPKEDAPRPVMGLVRMGRGRLMGVDQNTKQRWIGAGCNFYEPDV
ncbi:MAG: hypothetical protein H7X80_12090 [bacterium]|nr:hypothetical protein [Candidatus Kapabacteria bacterium]